MRHVPSRTLFALKSLDKSQIDGSDSQKCVVNEKNVMRRILLAFQLILLGFHRFS